MQKGGWEMKIVSQDRTSVTFQHRLEPKPEVSPNWYCPLLGCLTNTRLVRINTRKSTETIQHWLNAHPEISIYTVISHEPLFTQTEQAMIESGQLSKSHVSYLQQVKVGNEPYIDEFGFHVYISCRVGSKPDRDLRYEVEPEPELFNLEYIEHDLPDRKSYRAASGVQTGSVGMVSQLAHDK